MVNKKKKETSLVGAAMLYTIGTFLLKGINFITMPIFTNLLTTKDFGIIAIYTTWSGVFTIFIGLGINGTIGSAKANLSENEYREYLSSNMFLATISFIVILLMTILLNDLVSSLLGLSKFLCIVLVINSFFTFVINFVSSVYAFDKEPKKHLKLSIITTVLNIILSIMLVLSMSSNKYLGRIYGGVVVSILIGFILYLNIFFEGKKLISKKYWLYCLPMAIPIIFHNLSHLVLNQADIVMLQRYLDEGEVGIYSYSYNIGVMLNVIHMSINSAWVAYYFDSLKAKLNEEVEKRAKIYIAIFSVMTVLFILGGGEIIRILSPKTFWSGIDILPLIILGYYFVFLYTFGVNYEFYNKKTAFIASGTIVAAIINIGINLILIPKIGMMAAAISTLIAYFILFIMHEIIVRIILKHRDFSFKYYIYSIIFVLIFTVITYMFKDNILIRWGLIIFITLCMLIYGLKKFEFRRTY